MSKRFDPDELLALGLAYAPERYFGLVRTRDAILASARTARARAIETRSELSASRERSRAPLSGEAVMPRRPSPPLLVTQGSRDPINLPTISRELFFGAARPKFLLTLIGAGHLPPYSTNKRQLTIVEQVTIGFLNHYFKRAPLGELIAAGTVPRRAYLMSRP